MSWSSAIKSPLKSATRAVLQAFSPTPIIPRKIEWNRLVVIDFETYFSDEYTLKKMSTSEYIRDERFKVHMMGIKIGNRKTKVVPTNKVNAELQKIDWNHHDLCCHNTAFDGFILSHHYGVTSRFNYDTLSMARGLYGNDVDAGLDDVAQFLGKGNKHPDTLEKSRGALTLPKALYSEMSGYCANDVDLTFDIFKDMAPLTPVSEMQLIHITIRMFTDPVLRVDRDRVGKELVRELQEKEDLLMSIDVSGFPDKALKLAERSLPEKEKRLLKAKRIVGSSEKFADLLRAIGIDPPRKISPAWIKKPPKERTDDKKWSYAFSKDDADFLELPGRVDEWAPHLKRSRIKDLPKLVALQERIQALIDVRISVKSTTNVTRAQRFLNASDNGCALPVGYAYARAHTYRFGGNNSMNMQNLKRGGELRLSILAPKGHQLVVVDSGQIEARVNGWLWGQDDLMEAFKSADLWNKKTMGVARGINRDAYCQFADLVYGREITTEDPVERHVGKACVLGLGFQMGADKFQGTLAKGALGGPPVYFALDKCKAIVNAYRRKNYKIVQGWEMCKQIIEDMAAGRTGSWKCIHWEEGRIWGPDGTCLKYPDLQKGFNEDKGWDEWTYDSKGMRKKIYGGLLCENIIQWLARMIVCTQMLEIDKKCRVVMMTHDEVVACALTRSAPAVFKGMTLAFRTAPVWCSTMPLNSEGGFADNYSK